MLAGMEYGLRTYVIAEVGVNHNGSLALAKQMIEVAAESGADAVKFQTFKAENLVTRSAQRAGYQLKNQPDSELSQYDMLKRLELSQDDFAVLKDHCVNYSIDFLSTPFDESAASFLANLVHAFKIASGDLVTLPFLRHVGSLKKPVFLSTGMGTLEEVKLALATLKDAGAPEVHILHCTSNYPCEDHEVNLRAMVTIREALNVPVGYSDHTLGEYVAIAAVAMGATVLEKHFTLDQQMIGPDHKASATPAELRHYIQAVRHTERILGNGIKQPNESELAVAAVARKSLVWLENLSPGTLVCREHIGWKRPGTGLPTSHLELILGATLIRNVSRDSLVQNEDLGR